MIYSLEFDQRALKEWQKLDSSIRSQLKKKLAQILENPKIESNRLRELENCYKIKLRQSGYRLIYQVQDERVVVLVIAIGKRDKEQAYKGAKHRT
ncbi:type II toxin-antitoxin system RelE/ParE family toxin [Thiomicrospira sp. R3]|uniref:type II toxin-antitoxin system RelE family toxin n=1 Tax=Thiomicrospira sp. R3 TaxID=3035472 RepID=UPI00259B7373|nr:type II toxin-antitoxin system RelE/ParE family toxin [Thiomicrospira sp. R3]WFE68611.1 type II toxin-antitoxin system RelE/ParE family toxin [Thiomicrospira sp. R3]